MKAGSASGVRLVDLSVPLGPSPAEVVPVALEPLSHAAGGAHLAELAGVERADLPDGLGWASERVSAVTHSSTHMDAPFHYAPRCGGRMSRTIDELPLDWFWGPGLCVPAAGDAPLAPAELAAFERAQGVAAGPGDIVLFRTGAEEHHGTAAYAESGRGLAPELLRELVGRGVRVIGTDAWSIDPPLARMRERAARLGPRSVWAAHYVGRELEFCALERLANLSRLPAAGFWISCFPVKVAGGSAGWVRAVAILPTTEDEV